MDIIIEIDDQLFTKEINNQTTTIKRKYPSDNLLSQITISILNSNQTYQYIIVKDGSDYISGEIQNSILFDVSVGSYYITVNTEIELFHTLIVENNNIRLSSNSEWITVLDGDRFGTELLPIYVRKCCYDSLNETTLHLDITNEPFIPSDMPVLWSVTDKSNSKLTEYNGFASYSVNLEEGDYLLTVTGTVEVHFTQSLHIKIHYDENSKQLFKMYYDEHLIDGYSINSENNDCYSKSVQIHINRCERHHLVDYVYRWLDLKTRHKKVGIINQIDNEYLRDTVLYNNIWKLDVSVTKNKENLLSSSRMLKLVGKDMFDIDFENNGEILGTNLLEIAESDSVNCKIKFNVCNEQSYPYIVELQRVYKNSFVTMLTEMIFNDIEHSEPFQIDNLKYGKYKIKVKDNDNIYYTRSFNIMGTFKLQDIVIKVIDPEIDTRENIQDNKIRSSKTNKTYNLQPVHILSKHKQNSRDVININENFMDENMYYLDCCNKKVSIVADFQGAEFFDAVIVLKLNNMSNGDYFIFTATQDSPIITIPNSGAGIYQFTVELYIDDMLEGSVLFYFMIIEPELCSVMLNPCSQYVKCHGDKGTLVAEPFLKSPLEWQISYGDNNIHHILPWCPSASENEDQSVLLYRWQRDVNCEFVDIDPLTGDETESDLWSSTDTAENLPAGRYRVFVKQICEYYENDELLIKESCAVEAEASIYEPFPLVAKICTGSLLDLDCYSDTNGKVRLWVTGGTTPYWFRLYKSDYTPVDETANCEDMRKGLSAGDYIFNVTDSSDCEVEIPFTVTSPPKLEVKVKTDYDLGCSNLIACVTGGTPFPKDYCSKYAEHSDPESYLYRWCNTDTHALISTDHYIENIPSGQYEVTVTDARCCSVKVKTVLVVQCETQSKCDKCDGCELECESPCIKPECKPNKPVCKPECKPDLPFTKKRYEPEVCDKYEQIDLSIEIKKILISKSKFSIDPIVSGGQCPYTFKINGTLIDKPSRMSFSNWNKYTIVVTDGNGSSASTTF